jgi:hypothetical protein
MSSLASFTLPAASVRWRIDGAPGVPLDMLVAGLIGSGVEVESITPGAAYRLNGPEKLMRCLSEDLEKVDGLSAYLELRPTGTVNVSSRLAPAYPYRRTVTVHGAQDGAQMVMRAVDQGLTVREAGAHRWTVAGPTAALMAWHASVTLQPLDEVLQAYGLTAAQVAAEDQGVPMPTINVVLPTRATVSEIERNSQGSITRLTQTERTVPR